MAYYLVRAKPKEEKMEELKNALAENAFLEMRPFGKSVTKGLLGMRIENDESVIWEEEDYCLPTLAMERAAVLDTYFDDITVEHIEEGEGWTRIQNLPKMVPDAAESPQHGEWQSL